MKTNSSSNRLEAYSDEDLGLYMLLAAFTNGQKISSSSLSKKEIDELNKKEKNTNTPLSFSKKFTTTITIMR